MTLRLGCFRPTELLTGTGDAAGVGAPLAGNGKNSGWREPLIGVSSDDRCSPGRNSANSYQRSSNRRIATMRRELTYITPLLAAGAAAR